ncbi:MAG: FHA domain-containing protein [Nevskia sp.]|nr:FHA domain-containing protein [Nevskia sp.]
MWHLILLDAQGTEVQRNPITTESLTIGRGKDRRIVLPSNLVSRSHAQVLLQNGQPLLLDEGSANGTRLNGQPVTGQVPLADGDEIGIANIRLRVFLEQTAPPVSPAPDPSPYGGAEHPLSARELLERQMAGIRSHRDQTSGTASRKAAAFEQSWKNVVASMRDLQRQLRAERRIMYFTIDRDDREITVKVADPTRRGGGLVLMLSRRQPAGQHQDQMTVWLRAVGESDVHLPDPQEAMERFVQRIASRLA